jgi:hypothetical protein
VTLHVQINGRELFAAPYDPANLQATAREIDQMLPILRRLGHVAIFVSDGNVSHLIVRE